METYAPKGPAARVINFLSPMHRKHLFLKYSLQNAFKFSWVPSCGAWLWKWKWQKLPKNIVFQKVTKDFYVPQELFQKTKSQNLSHVNVDFFQTAQVKAIKDLKRSNLSHSFVSPEFCKVPGKANKSCPCVELDGRWQLL